MPLQILSGGIIDTCATNGLFVTSVHPLQIGEVELLAATVLVFGVFVMLNT